MISIILYLAGGVAVALFIGIAASANLLAIAAGVVLWVGTAYCALSALDRITGEQLLPQWRRLLLMCAAWPASGLYVANQVARERNAQRRKLLTDQFKVACFIVLGSLLFVLGIWTLSSTLSGGQVTALIFGPAFLAGAWVVGQRYGRRHLAWRNAAPQGRIIEAGHTDEMLLYWAAIVLLVAFGILILAVAL